jgi:nucleoid DNA-binding protein
MSSRRYKYREISQGAYDKMAAKRAQNKVDGVKRVKSERRALLHKIKFITGVSMVDVELVIKGLTEVISLSLRRGDNCRVFGLGTFKVKLSRQRLAYMPALAVVGQPLPTKQIPLRKVMKLTTSTLFNKRFL